METVKPNVKNTLNINVEALMSKETVLVNEIIALDEVRACLNYFLASYYSQQYSGTAVEAELQMMIVCANIAELKAELKEVREILTRALKTEVVDLMDNDAETKAIMLFNKDKRFSCTE